MMHLLAQGTPIGNFIGIGEIANINRGVPVGSALAIFAQTISAIIGVLTTAAGLWFIFQIIMGAVGWLSAGSDKQALDNAKKRLTNAIVGLLIVVASFALIGIVGLFLGIDLYNVVGLITDIVNNP